MAAPKIGDQLINDAGTVVTLAEASNIFTGEIDAARADEYLAAGYRAVKANDVIPKQAWEVEAERQKREA